MVGDRGGASQECVAQGVANVATGFFGGMGGCAMIGQSMINVNSGGRTRFAAVASALFLLLFILVASPIIDWCGFCHGLFELFLHVAGPMLDDQIDEFSLCYLAYWFLAAFRNN